MALTVKHAFVSGVADDAAAAATGKVVPSNWNADHVVSGALPTTIVITASYAATTTVDLASYASYSIVIIDLTLTGNVIFNLINGTNGQAIKLRCRQDATGSRIWTSGANLRFNADITSIVLSTAASKLDYIGFEWNDTDTKADVLAVRKGF